jgi:hypothetical protein
VTDPVKQEQKASAANSERGTQSPGDPLQTAVDMLSRVRDAVGFSAASRESIAAALGYSSLSGTANRKLGTLSHFDLLERSGKGALRISSLGKSILVPTSTSERDQAVAEAAKRPNLYAKLIEIHKNETLPTLLPNLLIREHGVLPSSADAVARNFRDSMEFAGLMRNGILYESASASAPSEQSQDPPSATDSPSGPSQSQKDEHRSTPRFEGISIPLDAAGRMAKIELPYPISPRDLRRISAWVVYMESMLEENEMPDISDR